MTRRAAASPLDRCPGWPEPCLELGYTVALGYANAAGSDVPVWLWALTVITYGWVLANLLLLFLPSGKPAHDRLAGTIVVRTTS